MLYSWYLPLRSLRTYDALSLMRNPQSIIERWATEQIKWKNRKEENKLFSCESKLLMVILSSKNWLICCASFREEIDKFLTF